jgi:NDP-sugar pyrophosphorylase family protein
LLRDNGIRRVVLCIGYLGEMLRDHLGDGGRFSMELKYAFDGAKLLGTGGAVRRALPMLGETFWVMYGDSYMDIDYRAVLASFARSGADGLMTVLRNEDQWDRSNVVFRDGKLLRYDKREQTADMNYVDYGVAILRKDAAERLPEDEVSDLADLYRDMVAEGRMVGYEVTQRFYEIGSPQGLRETQEYLATRTPLEEN